MPRSHRPGVTALTLHAPGYYVHPAVFETYLAGTMLEALGNGNGTAAAAAAAVLSAEEQAVVRLLSRRG